MNQKQHSFVTEYLRLGDKIVAYKIAYQSDSTNYDAVLSAANRLLRDPEIAKAIEDVQSRIRAEVERELKEELRRDLLTVQRKRELLASIATGEISVIQNYKGKDCKTCTQFVKPTINQMLKAIDIDSKLAGHYVSSNPATKTSSTQPVKVAKQERAEQTEPSPEQDQIAPTQELDVITEETMQRFLSPEVNNGKAISLTSTKQYQQLE